MGTRTDLPKIKPDEQPSIVNGEAAGWGLLGGFVGSMAASIIGKGTQGIGLANSAGLAIGGILGGLKGKSRLEHEQQEGRVVKTPGYWNRGIINGLFAGFLVHVPLVTLVKNGNLSRGWAMASAWGTIGAMITGSIWRKNSLQHDFDKSVAIRDSNQAKVNQLLNEAAKLTPPVADEPASYKNSVTPDEVTALLEKQAQAPQVEKPAHTGHTAHADKHEPATSHTEHAIKPEANTAMAMGA